MLGRSFETELRKIFGRGATYWPANILFTDHSHLPPIARGYILHLYVEDPPPPERAYARWLGHTGW